MTTAAPGQSDILRVAEHKRWPAVTIGRLTVGPGERDWRRVVPRLEYDERAAIWEYWQSGSRLQTRGAASTIRRDDEAPDALQPSAREFAVFVRASAAALKWGLAVQPERIRFTWFDVWSGDEAYGYTGLRDGGQIEISLRRGLTDGELFQVVLHELKHAADLIHLGGAAYEELGIAELERRARAFESTVMLAEGYEVLF